jgi:cell division septation protein DedD
MASRRNKKGGWSFISTILKILIGFILGVYLSPKLADVLPEEMLSHFGIKKMQSTSQEKIERGKSIRETKRTEASDKLYSLEVAVFSDIQSAAGLVDTLNTRGYFPDIQTVKGRDGVIYKVRIGSWTSKEEAVSYARTFETNEEMKVTVVEIK